MKHVKIHTVFFLKTVFHLEFFNYILPQYSPLWVIDNIFKIVEILQLLKHRTNYNKILCSLSSHFQSCKLKDQRWRRSCCPRLLFLSPL